MANSKLMRKQGTIARDLSSLAVVDALVADLHGWDRNPRKIKPARLEQLKAMLTSSPEMLKARPLIALPDGTVIAGNQRLAAAVALGWESIPAVFVDLDEATAIEWALRDNNPAGESDDDLTALLLADLSERGRALDMTGFAPSDLSALLRRVAPKSDPDAVPAVPKTPLSKLGEVYALGNHRLMCGDAGKQIDVNSLVAGMVFSSMVTDPPYGIGRDGVTNDQEAGLSALFDSVLACAPLTNAVAAAFQSPRLVAVWLDAIRVVSHRIERLLWLHRPAGKTFPWNGWILASDAIVLSSIGNPVWPEPASFVHDTYVKTALESSSLTGIHTTIKPSWVCADLIAKLPSGPVYEPFAGSGTTLIAAEQLGRVCYAMEIDPAYCDVIRQRYADYVDDQSYAP